MEDSHFGCKQIFLKKKTLVDDNSINIFPMYQIFLKKYTLVDDNLINISQCNGDLNPP
jgi:hypothetical protein